MILGTILVIGAIILVAKWGTLVEKFFDFVSRIKAFWQKIRMSVPHGARMIGDIVVEGGSVLAAIMHQLYYKDRGQWMERTTTCKVDANEVPLEIRNKIEQAHDQVDITKEMEKELKLQI